ncbi:hypothetical protein Mal15_38210 [Stieleria maiorica]|uniref:Uncharacterized protein n=1 Tax=Stieleria maiorica TaxID=2795974 RepID=A0A5B9MJH4_9BACT|nr:hypothetical protein [Stieleria maiorica]QEF99755.1 hypothetical protein Mal15_38210 [Stieleria maiorica]
MNEPKPIPKKCYCGEDFIRTPSGYCCPKPHGKLFLASLDHDVDDRLDELEQTEPVKPVVECRGSFLFSLRSLCTQVLETEMPDELRDHLLVVVKWHVDAALEYVDAVDGCLQSMAEAEVKGGAK